MLISSTANDFKNRLKEIQGNDIPPDLQIIINHGHKGCMMDVQGADADNVFDIEVETVLNQAPQVSFILNLTTSDPYS